MTESEGVSVRKRRSLQEIKRLVREFEWVAHESAYPGSLMRTILKINLIIFHLEIDVTRAIARLRLLLHLNLVFLPLVVASYCAAGYIIRGQLRKITEEEVLENARVMMQTARASRVYTTRQVAPLLEHEQARVDRVTGSLHQVLEEHLPVAFQKSEVFLPTKQIASCNG